MVTLVYQRDRLFLGFGKYRKAAFPDTCPDPWIQNFKLFHLTAQN